MPTPKRKISPLKSLWQGPVEDGITYSQLCKFLVCRERFRLYMVEGLREPETFRHPLEFGNLWHIAEEHFSGGRQWTKPVLDYANKLTMQYPGSEKDILKWAKIAIKLYPLYIEYYASTETKRIPVAEESSFRIPYITQTGNQVTLRGKIDCIYDSPSGRMIQENKTKGDIDAEGIQKAIPLNLQTMIYRTAIESLVVLPRTKIPKDSQALWGLLHKSPRGFYGTLYNVIIRPLSDRYSIRQKKAESIDEFIERIAANVTKTPERTFFRWNVRITHQDVERFTQRVLDPLLDSLLCWWESIKTDPFNPWKSPLHYMTPYGVYNPLASGFRGDYFQFLTGDESHKWKLQKVSNLYPEL